MLIANLTHALLAGKWSKPAMLARVRQACRGCDPARLRWTRLLVKAVWERFGPQAPCPEELQLLVRTFSRSRRHLVGLEVHRVYFLAPTMAPRWPVPEIATVAQLADWLDVPIPRLEWLADLKGMNHRRPAAKLQHYVRRQIPRPRGEPRQLESPKPRLKAIQRRLLHEILDKIPPHDAAHGFRAGRSIVSYVEPHVGRRIVIRFDVRDFFASITAMRVRAIFRVAGYPDEVARFLAGLCTTRTPDAAAGTPPLDPRWRRAHLPQGAPTSPALANLAAYRLDVRLHALAQSLGAAYTRYADDLAFSGDESLARSARRLQVLVAVIAAEEGFELRFRKSRFMRRGVRQQIAGVVVNDKPNVKRESFDLLKATLHNCVRHGPAGQNREGHADFRSHLRGRVAHVAHLNPPRGAKLQALFDRIDWPAPAT